MGDGLQAVSGVMSEYAELGRVTRPDEAVEILIAEVVRLNERVEYLVTQSGYLALDAHPRD